MGKGYTMYGLKTPKGEIKMTGFFVDEFSLIRSCLGALSYDITEYTELKEVFHSTLGVIGYTIVKVQVTEIE